MEGNRNEATYDESTLVDHDGNAGIGRIRTLTFLRLSDSQAGFSIRRIAPIEHVNRCFIPPCLSLEIMMHLSTNVLRLKMKREMLLLIEEHDAIFSGSN